MSTSSTSDRIDPLVDAYRQASELQAQSAGARPASALRAAVLAHARVVAQSAATAEPVLAVSEAVRAVPAANESKPVWRMVAGVMLGLAGMWAYQLTRPGATDETNVAVMTAPQGEKSAPPESANSPDSPVTGGAASIVAPATPANATDGAPAQRDASVAIAALPAPPPAPAPAPALRAIIPEPVMAAREIPSRDRAGATSNSAGAIGLRDGSLAAAHSDTSVALAKVHAPTMRAEQAASADVRTAAAATAPVGRAPAAPATTTAATSSSPEAATAEPFAETVVASVERRKAARVSPSAPTAGAAPPNAFPATTLGEMAGAAGPPAAPSMSPQSTRAAASASTRQGVASTAEEAMFRAIRINDVNALRAALARGANVNARDESGRSALQIASDRGDTEVVKALLLARAQ